MGFEIKILQNEMKVILSLHRSATYIVFLFVKETGGSVWGITPELS